MDDITVHTTRQTETKSFCTVQTSCTDARADERGKKCGEAELQLGIVSEAKRLAGMPN